MKLGCTHLLSILAGISLRGSIAPNLESVNMNFVLGADESQNPLDSADSESVRDFDIASVATRFDTSNSYFFIDQVGTRFGPSRIGLGSRISTPAYPVYRKTFNPYKNWAKLVDCGDPPVRPLDNKIVLERVIREHLIK
ncbi:hydrolase activity protein [[Candida] boidinii]|nr:hydrolase activity protein [[Candida] boidinii]